MKLGSECQVRWNSYALQLLNKAFHKYFFGGLQSENEN
jgi:hypothetical protein